MAKKRTSDEVKRDEEAEALRTPVRDPNTSAPAPGDVVFPARNRRAAIFTQREVLEGESDEGDPVDQDEFGPSEEEVEARVARAEDAEEAESADSDDSDSDDS